MPVLDHSAHSPLTHLCPDTPLSKSRLLLGKGLEEMSSDFVCVSSVESLFLFEVLFSEALEGTQSTIQILPPPSSFFLRLFSLSLDYRECVHKCGYHSLQVL